MAAGVEKGCLVKGFDFCENLTRQSAILQQMCRSSNETLEANCNGGQNTAKYLQLTTLYCPLLIVFQIKFGSLAA